MIFIKRGRWTAVLVTKNNILILNVCFFFFSLPQVSSQLRFKHFSFQDSQEPPPSVSISSQPQAKVIIFNELYNIQFYTSLIVFSHILQVWTKLDIFIEIPSKNPRDLIGANK